MTVTRSFLGIPIAGDIVKADRAVQQRPLEEFSPLLQVILNDPHVTEFGWQQYTPYFNDGEPCVFGAGGVWIRTTDDSEDTPRGELNINHHHRTLSPYRWNDNAGRYDHVGMTPYNTARWERCKALADAIESGAFDDVLLEAFGDHADITVEKTAITVERYEHD